MPTTRKELAALWKEIGSEERLGRILHDFYHRMKDDLLIGYFFDGKDVDAIARNQQALLLKAMGASPVYLGKAPAFAHLGLPKILAGHFDRRLVLLRETLEKHGLSAEGVRIWVEFEAAFRESLVQEEGSSRPAQ